MKNQITEIPSDTTINQIQTTGNGLIVHLTLYTEESIKLNFQQVYAYKAIVWGKDEAVEGLLLTDDSELLGSTLKKLQELKVPDLREIKSFQFTSIDGVLLEVIALKLMIGEEVYGN